MGKKNCYLTAKNHCLLTNPHIMKYNIVSLVYYIKYVYKFKEFLLTIK